MNVERDDALQSEAADETTLAHDHHSARDEFTNLIDHWTEYSCERAFGEQESGDQEKKLRQRILRPTVVRNVHKFPATITQASNAAHFQSLLLSSP